MASSKVDGIVGRIAQTFCEVSCVSENPALLIWMKMVLRHAACDPLAQSRDWMCLYI